MQLTYILGNGFDVAIGLATTYSAFYEWYNKQCSESEEVILLKDTIDKEIKKGNDNWKDFEYALGQFTLKVPDKKKYMDCFQNARRSLIEYLSMVYSNANAANNDFLKSATYRLIDRSQNSDSDLADEYKSLFSTPKDTEMIFNCISFNYTPVLSDGRDELISNARGFTNAYSRPSRYDIGEVLNVHGTLNDYPILGVDNITQIANETFRADEEIIQMMIKGEIDKKLGRNWRRDAINIIKKSDKIYVYGASLGETDEFWWKTLAQWLEADENHQLALYCHPEANEQDMLKKTEQFLNSIAKYLNNKELKLKIAIDNVAKKMTVNFVYLSAQTEIKSTMIANVHAVEMQH